MGGFTVWLRDRDSGSARVESAEGAGSVRINQDITERLTLEQQLREARDYLENLFGYANAPVIVWDPELRITRFNHAFE